MEHPLRVVHFSTADNEGGSGRAAYRIHSGLRGLGHDSHMLVGRKVTDDPDVELTHGGGIGRLKDLAIERITQKMGLQYIYLPSSRRVLNHSWIKRAQIIQLYNTHGGYFSHQILPRLSLYAPIVWRFSDMWPMTTHAAYAYDCSCYKDGPRQCTCALDSYPSIGHDTRHLLWKVKERAYSRSDLTIIAPSRWMKGLVKESILLQRFPVRRIPNGIDLTVYKQWNRLFCRRVFGLPSAAFVLFFPADSLAVDNPRKGVRIVKNALSRLAHLSDIVLMVAGGDGSHFQDGLPFPVKHLGYVRDDRLLAMAYSSSDLLLAPSVAENLPNTVLEALACGLPSVAFDTGGMADAVHHMNTGYLVSTVNEHAFAEGIMFLIENDSLRLRMKRSCELLARQEFNQDIQTSRFVELYQELVWKQQEQRSRL